MWLSLIVMWLQVLLSGSWLVHVWTPADRQILRRPTSWKEIHLRNLNPFSFYINLQWGLEWSHQYSHFSTATIGLMLFGSAGGCLNIRITKEYYELLDATGRNPEGAGGSPIRCSEPMEMVFSVCFWDVQDWTQPGWGGLWYSISRSLRIHWIVWSFRRTWIPATNGNLFVASAESAKIQGLFGEEDLHLITDEKPSHLAALSGPCRHKVL